MKILFTKKIDPNLVIQHLGNDILADYVEVIKIVPVTVKTFDLKNDSIIFTSKNGVESFFKNGFQPHENFMNPHEFNKIYAVGLKTKLQIRRQGFGTFKVTKHASELSEFIIEHSVKERFLHFCGNLALDVLDKALPLQNISYKKIVVYKTNLLYPKISEKYDAAVFFSPSGVRSFAKHNSLENLKLFSIGETTEKELKKHTKSDVFTSKESNLEDLLSVIRCQLSE